MSDRIKALIVHLETDLRDDDAKGLEDALRRIRGVSSVTPLIAEPDHMIAVERARLDLVKDLWAVLNPLKKRG